MKRVRQGSAIARLLAATAIAVGTVATAHAQDAAPAAPADAEASSVDIIVTAQRRTERSIDVPISVQAIGGEQLAAAGVTDGRLLEQASPALSFQTGYAVQATSFAIRGISSSASEGGLQPSVGIVVDNMPLARQGEVLLELADIERIEVLSGPQGTLFGKNSTAGVVNIVTKRPTRDFGTEFEVSATNDGEVLSKGVLNVPISPSIAGRLNGYYHYIDPLVDNDVNDDVMGLRSYGAAGKLLFGVGAPVNFLLSANYNRSYNTMGALFVISALPGPLGEKQEEVNPYIGWGQTRVSQDTLSYQKTESYSFIGELNAELSDTLNLVSITGYRRFEFFDDIDVDAGPTGGVIGRGISDPAVGPLPGSYPLGWYGYKDGHEGSYYDYWSQELRLAYSAPGIDIVGGAFYQDFKEFRYLRNPFLFDGTFVGAPAGLTFLNQTDTFSGIKDKTYAVFGDATVGITDTIDVFAGLRFNHEKIGLDYDRDVYFTLVGPGTFDPVTGVIGVPPISELTFSYEDSAKSVDNLSGRAGIKFQPDRDTNIYFSYNRGYKGPAVNRTTGVLDADSVILKPEIADAFEIGFKKRFFDRRVGVDLSLYKQKVKNVQQASIRPGTIIPDLINAGDLKTDGFELNVNARPVDGLTLTAGVVYNDARYANGVVFNCGPTQVNTGTCPDDPDAGFQVLDGKQAIFVPKWKVVSTAAYEFPVADDLKMGLRAQYNWRSDVQGTLFQDPLTVSPSRGQLDASVSVGAEDDGWEVTLFGRNLNNSFYYGWINTVSVIGTNYGNLPRDFERYFGIRLNYRH